MSGDGDFDDVPSRQRVLEPSPEILDLVLLLSSAFLLESVSLPLLWADDETGDNDFLIFDVEEVFDEDNIFEGEEAEVLDADDNAAVVVVLADEDIVFAAALVVAVVVVAIVAIVAADCWLFLLDINSDLKLDAFSTRLGETASLAEDTELFGDEDGISGRLTLQLCVLSGVRLNMASDSLPLDATLVSCLRMTPRRARTEIAEEEGCGPASLSDFSEPDASDPENFWMS